MRRAPAVQARSRVAFDQPAQLQEPEELKSGASAKWRNIGVMSRQTVPARRRRAVTTCMSSLKYGLCLGRVFDAQRVADQLHLPPELRGEADERR
jgi:hypothetical protein